MVTASSILDEKTSYVVSERRAGHPSRTTFKLCWVWTVLTGAELHQPITAQQEAGVANGCRARLMGEITAYHCCAGAAVYFLFLESVPTYLIFHQED